VAGFVDVAASGEVPEGEARGFAGGGVEIAIARVGGALLAFSDICTHRRCNLAMGGEIDGTSITCECHGSTFSMATGEVEEGPADQPIAVFPVREAAGRVEVEVGDA